MRFRRAGNAGRFHQSGVDVIACSDTEISDGEVGAITRRQGRFILPDAWRAG
jgi:hypothetical protein